MGLGSMACPAPCWRPGKGQQVRACAATAPMAAAHTAGRMLVRATEGGEPAQERGRCRLGLLSRLVAGWPSRLSSAVVRAGRPPRCPAFCPLIPPPLQGAARLRAGSGEHMLYRELKILQPIVLFMDDSIAAQVPCDACCRHFSRLQCKGGSRLPEQSMLTLPCLSSPAHQPLNPRPAAPADPPAAGQALLAGRPLARQLAQRRRPPPAGEGAWAVTQPLRPCFNLLPLAA